MVREDAKDVIYMKQTRPRLIDILRMKCTKDLRCRRPRKSDFDLHHDRPEMFVLSQFGPPWVGVIWHAAWCSYLTIALFLEMLVYNTADTKPKWLIYAKNWSYLLVIFTAFVEFLCRTTTLLTMKFLANDGAHSMTWYHKAQWICINVNNVVSILVTCLQLIVVSPKSTFVCVNRVTSPTLYVLLTNTVVNIQPVKVFHFYQPSAFVVIFICVATIVQANFKDVPNETLIFRCDKPLRAGLISVCIVFIVIPILHFLFYAVYKLRIFLCKKRFRTLSGSSCSLQVPIQRDITATDVVFHYNESGTYIDLTPDTRDDITVHMGAAGNSKYANKPINWRTHKSETDLREYRSQNGLYCDFAPASGIFYHTELDDSEPDENSPSTPNGSRCTSNECSQSTPNGSRCTSKSSQIILVKACNSYVNEAFENDSYCSDTDCRSNASSDFFS